LTKSSYRNDLDKVEFWREIM